MPDHSTTETRLREPGRPPVPSRGRHLEGVITDGPSMR